MGREKKQVGNSMSIQGTGRRLVAGTKAGNRGRGDEPGESRRAVLGLSSLTVQLLPQDLP